MKATSMQAASVKPRRQYVGCRFQSSRIRVAVWFHILHLKISITH